MFFFNVTIEISTKCGKEQNKLPVNVKH